MSILTGASESDLKNSLNMTSGLNISHYSDDNEEQEPTNNNNSKNITTKHVVITNEELSNVDSSNTDSSNTKTNTEKVNNIENKRAADLLYPNKNSTIMPKKKKLKKASKENNSALETKIVNDTKINTTEAAVVKIKSETVTDLDLNKEKIQLDQQTLGAVVEATQPDEEIKELLKNDNINSTNQSNIILKSVSSPSCINGTSILTGIINQSQPRKITTDELKELIQKEKQHTAELFKQLLKSQENDQSLMAQSSQQQPNYMHQNSNSSDISITELSNIHNNMSNNNIQSNQNFFHQQHLISQRIKSTTPSCVDQLLISPLFNHFLPSCGSTSSNSSNSSSSCSSLNNNLMQNTNVGTNNILSFSQFATAAASVSKNVNSRNTPLSFLMIGGNGVGEVEEMTVSNSNSVNSKITHASRSSFKRTKHISSNTKSKNSLFLFDTSTMVD